MGTRADFYVGKGTEAEWLGSIAWDGYPGGIDDYVLDSQDEKRFRTNVDTFLSQREDATYPKDGWPWPWEDSRTTDYAYCFFDEKVWASCFGNEWFDPRKEEPDHEYIRKQERLIFPNMESKQNVTLGKRSGVTLFTSK